VTFAYGRRGSTLKTGTKTPEPVSRERAEKIYRKLAASKMARGYTPGEDGTPYRNTAAEPADTGVRPQLPNPVGEKEAKALLKDGMFCLQEWSGATCAAHRSAIILYTMVENALRAGQQHPEAWMTDVLTRVDDQPGRSFGPAAPQPRPPAARAPAAGTCADRVPKTGPIVHR